MSNSKHLQRAGLLAVLGVSTAAVLSGCGGAKTNSGQPGGVATPTVYGINLATSAIGSGIAFPSGDGMTTLGGIVGALSTTATPLEGSGGFAFGFPTNAAEADGSTGIAVPTSYPGVVFGALIANGNVGSTSAAITGATLTSPEVAGFKQTLTFTGVGNGPIGSAGYTSPAFTLPFTTTGIHEFNATATDEGGQSGTTTLGVAVVAPTDVALFFQSFDTGKPDPASTTTPPADLLNAIAPGDLVTIDGGKGTGVYPSGFAATTADPQGTVIFFTQPGKHTVVETDPTGKTVVNTSTFTIGPKAVGATLIGAVPAPGVTSQPALRPGSNPHLMLSPASLRRH